MFYYSFPKCIGFTTLGAKSNFFYVTVTKCFLKLKNTEPPVSYLMLYEQPKEGINQKQIRPVPIQEIGIAWRGRLQPAE